MHHAEIPCPAAFHFRDVVFSHGWVQLPPHAWDVDTETLARIERLPDGRVVRYSVRAEATPQRRLVLETDGGADTLPLLLQQVRWTLALDEDFREFYALCAAEPGLRGAAERGQGRILRSPTVWEDVVKTLFSVNTTWGQTIAMTRNLTALCGEPHSEAGRTFPTPAAVAALEPEELQRVCRVGYRAGPLSRLARDLAEGRLDLEALKDPALTTEEVESRLRALQGIGPYAAANVLMLLGRYDHLPVDSWFRKTVREGWFEGGAVSDRELVAAFDRFRPYRTLVYVFYDWAGARAGG